MAQDHLTTRGTQDGDLICSQILMMKMLKVPFYWIFFVNNAIPEYLLGSKKILATTDMPTPNMPVRIHCKTGTTFARLVFETRAKCQDLMARFKDDGLPSCCFSSFL